MKRVYKKEKVMGFDAKIDLPKIQTVRELAIEMDGLEALKLFNATEKLLNTPIITDDFRENLIKNIEDFKNMKKEKETVLEQREFYRERTEFLNVIKETQGQEKIKLIEEQLKMVEDFEPIEILKNHHEEFLDIMKDLQNNPDLLGSTFYKDRRKSLKKLSSLKRADKIILLKKEIELLKNRKPSEFFAENHNELLESFVRLLVLEEEENILSFVINKIKDVFKKEEL